MKYFKLLEAKNNAFVECDIEVVGVLYGVIVHNYHAATSILNQVIYAQS